MGDGYIHVGMISERAITIDKDTVNIPYYTVVLKPIMFLTVNVCVTIRVVVRYVILHNCNVDSLAIEDIVFLLPPLPSAKVTIC